MEETIDWRAYEGKTIGDRYYLERFINKGAFAAVFKASHQAYGVEMREVAIKIARRKMTGDEARRRFHDALEMARMVDSVTDAALREHFVTVYDAGLCPEGGPLAGHPYVVMEYAPLDLNMCLKAGAFPLTRAVNYFNQILQAVAFMHSRSRSTIHRDLKPSNILVVQRQEGEDLIKVADFGLVVEVGELLGWAESGGDLAYLAPESFSRNICSTTSDVYMLGLVFYEMLAGRNPFGSVGSYLRGSDEEKKDELRRLHLRARELETFPELDRNVELKLRPALRQVIRAALDFSEDLRPYKNAGELWLAWQQAQKSVVVGPPPNNPPEEPPPDEPPETVVKRLTDKAKQCFAVGDWARGDQLLEQALALNRNGAKMPKPYGACYLLAVERRLAQYQEELKSHGKELAKHWKEEAGVLANEGYQRRECRSTCLAMARYYEADDSSNAGGFYRKAETCPDRS